VVPLIVKPEESTSQVGQRERNKRLTREKILRAALVLFQRPAGVAGTSMGEIAELAGVSDTTVYNYFKTKDELVDDFLAEMTGASDIAKLLASRPASESPFRALRTVLRDADATDDDLHARLDLLQRIRDDRLLLGAYLRTVELLAEDLAAAFAQRAPQWGPDEAVIAARATAGALAGVLEVQSEHATMASWKADIDAALRRLERAWRQ
jgi:AcrR family transcriptional regulator